jgi:hypothetical protein
MSRNALWLGIAIGAFVLLAGEHFQPSHTLAQTSSVKNPSCAKGTDTFICVGDLDGNGLQQIMVGYVVFNTGYMIVFDNTGVTRRRICWGTCSTPPTVASQAGP